MKTSPASYKKRGLQKGWKWSSHYFVQKGLIHTLPGNGPLRVMNACSYVDVASNDDRPLQRVAVQSLGLGARVQIASWLQALANNMSTPYPLKIQPVTPRSCACIVCIAELVRSVNPSLCSAQIRQASVASVL